MPDDNSEPRSNFVTDPEKRARQIEADEAMALQQAIAAGDPEVRQFFEAEPAPEPQVRRDLIVPMEGRSPSTKVSDERNYVRKLFGSEKADWLQ